MLGFDEGFQSGLNNENNEFFTTNDVQKIVNISVTANFCLLILKHLSYQVFMQKTQDRQSPGAIFEIPFVL
jgi:predicted transcriptional regulator